MEALSELLLISLRVETLKKEIDRDLERVKAKREEIARLIAKTEELYKESDR